MFRTVSSVQIQQVPSDQWPNRKTLLNFDFLTKYEAGDSWRDMTNKGKLVIPKNLYFRDQFNRRRPLHGTNVNIGGFSSNAPLVLRGDSVVMSVGYKYFAKRNDQRETTSVSKIFTGYVSKVGSKIPIEIELEDNMWLLKQTPVDTMTFTKSQGLNSILQYLVGKTNAQFGTSLTTNALTETTFGTFPIGNETCAQVLQRLQKTYGFESYFRVNELRCGSIIYIPSEAQQRTFTFQVDIIDDDNIEYQRKDDITLSAIARNTIVEETGKFTKDGIAKTKRVRLEVLVSLRGGKTTVKQINTGDKIAPNVEGERRTLFYPGATTIAQLSQLAINELQKYYYDGLKGYFTTFALPFVRMGDDVTLIDNIMPERNGTYRVKEVDYSGSISEGFRQKIHLDFKINV
jgi:hypothetical protein